MNVLDTVRRFRYCNGIKEVENENLYIKSFLSKNGDENSGQLIYKSLKCTELLSYVSRDTTFSCEECTRNPKADDDISDKHDDIKSDDNDLI